MKAPLKSSLVTVLLSGCSAMLPFVEKGAEIVVEEAIEEIGEQIEEYEKDKLKAESAVPSKA